MLREDRFRRAKQEPERHERDRNIDQAEDDPTRDTMFADMQPMLGIGKRRELTALVLEQLPGVVEP
ncbi:MAG TPA: hypothetical protein VF469_08595 [Kofleriaceae bacterium]